jgi:hypothetical protein
MDGSTTDGSTTDGSTTDGSGTVEPSAPSGSASDGDTAPGTVGSAASGSTSTTESATTTTTTTTSGLGTTSSSRHATGVAACRTSNLKLSLGKREGAAGSTYVQLVFTNTGRSACSLHGFPGVSYVTGDEGRQVGAAANWSGHKGSPVVVGPGEMATADLQETDIENFPAKACHPTKVRGLRVYPPGEKHALYVPQKGARGCAKKTLPDKQFQLSVHSITEG